MAGRLQLDRVRTEVEGFKAMLQMLAAGGEDLQNVMRYLDERMRDLNRLLRESLFNKSKESAALSHPITASAALSPTRVFPFTPKMT